MADETTITLSHELFDALNSDNLTVAELLLQKGADPNCVLPVEGVAPIHIASGLGAPATKLLLQCGGEPNIRSVDGTTPLHVASMWGNEECLQLLLVFGGDPFIRDQDGCTALDYAKSYDHKHCIRRLEYFALLLNPDTDSITAPNIIYKCRDEMDDSISDRSKAFSQKRRQSVNQSFGYLEEYLDWAYNQDSITEYTDEITRQLRKYVSHHAENQLSLDVTSPDHPYLEYKSQSEDSDVSSVETNDLAFRQDSLHVHWADEHSKTLPWNLSDQDKLNSTSSSTDTFLTCPSELDDKDCTNFEKSKDSSYLQDYSSKENRPFNVTEPRNRQKSLQQDIQAHKSNRNTNGNFKEDLRNDSKCQDCESLRKCDFQKFDQKSSSSSDIVYSHVKLPDDISNTKLPGNVDRLSRKPKVRCEREIQNWLNSAQPEKLSCGFKRLSLQDNKQEDLWQPPSDCQELDLTDLISSDGSFYQRHEKRTEGKNERPKNSARSSGSSFVFDRCDKTPKKEVLAKLPTNLPPNVRNSCDLSYPSSQVENPTLTESFGNFSTIDLDETLSYDLENYCKDSKSNYKRNSEESVESDIFNRSFCDSRISFGSVSSDASTVEYIYSDPEKGISLIEKRVPSHCGSVSSRRSSLESALSTGTIDSQKTELYDWKTHCNYPLKQKGNSVHEKDDAVDEVKHSDRKIPQLLKRLSNREIREKLQSLGDDPGPVTMTTRQTYLTRLMNAEDDPNFIQMQLTDKQPGYPPEMKAALEGNFDVSGMGELEMKMINAFQNPAKNRRWREGTLKSSFNYLLLDPRVTRNLPQRSGSLSELETFQTFIAAIFYVGKGKRARPYCHLYEAINQLKNPKPKVSEKVQHILDVWKDGLGVVSLHCFQSVIPVEAYTREACMVDSLSLNKLTNKKRGDYYGVATTWSLKEKRKMGVFLLKKSLQIFLGDGERQISPADIKVGQ